MMNPNDPTHRYVQQAQTREIRLLTGVGGVHQGGRRRAMQRFASYVARLASANGRAILIASLIVLAGRVASSQGAGALRGWGVGKDAGFEEVSSRP